VNVACGLLESGTDGYTSVTFDDITVTVVNPSVPTVSQDVTFT